MTNELEKLKAERDSYIDKYFLESQKMVNLRKVLKEIKEIANKIANYYDGDEYELMRKDAEQILQKISEYEE